MKKKNSRGCRMKTYTWNGELTANAPFAYRRFSGDYKDYAFVYIFGGE